MEKCWANTTFGGDYIGLAAPRGNDVYPVWTDIRNYNSRPDIYGALYNTSAPAAPQNLVTSGSTGQHVTVSWSANSECDLSGYYLYRKVLPDQSQYFLIATLGASTTSYVDNECTVRTGTGGQYAYYYAKAYDVASRVSGPSDTAYKPVNYTPGIANNEGPKPAIRPIPDEFGLSQCYPNPFNPSTRLKYQLAQDSHVVLILYDVLGRQVRNIVDEEQPAGFYELTVDGSPLASGVYFARFVASDQSGNTKFIGVNKLVLLK